MESNEDSRDDLLHLGEPLELPEEPLVDVGHLVDLVDGVASSERGSDGEESLVGRVPDLVVDVLHVVVLMRKKRGER